MGERADVQRFCGLPSLVCIFLSPLLLRRCSPLICFAAVFVRLVLYSPRCCCFSFFSFFSFFVFAFHVHFLLSIEFNGVALQQGPPVKWASAPRVEVDRSTWSENHANGAAAVAESGPQGLLGWFCWPQTETEGASVRRRGSCSMLHPSVSACALCLAGGRKNPNATKIPFCPIGLLDRGLLLWGLTGAASNR